MLDKDPKQWMPLSRRFTQVWFFPELRPDGTPNVPTPSEEPYYIDQTEEFKTFNHDYAQAMDHARDNWALEEPDSYDATTSTVYAPGFNANKRVRVN